MVLLTLSQVMFLDVESLHSINSTLLRGLEERLAAWGSQAGMGDVFLTLMPYLKVYTSFTNNFDNALQTIQVWRV